jgi:hypothetical protein
MEILELFPFFVLPLDLGGGGEKAAGRCWPVFLFVRCKKMGAWGMFSVGVREKTGGKTG